MTLQFLFGDGEADPVVVHVELGVEAAAEKMQCHYHYLLGQIRSKQKH